MNFIAIILSIEEYLKNWTIFKSIIYDLKRKCRKLRIQLTIAVTIMSCKDHEEERVMQQKTDNIKLIINDKEDEVNEEIFQSLLSGYQMGWKN